MTASLVKIDELVLDQHYYLSNADNCYYLLEYISGDGFRNPTNDLILNFKQLVKFKGGPSWKYKLQAIDQVAGLLRQHLLPAITLADTTIIPIPPSKASSDPLYDDRTFQALQLFSEGKGDIRKLIRVNETQEPFHDGHRNIAELQQNLSLDHALIDSVKNQIILFDDVLTSGAHFVACKNVLKVQFPQASIVGVFIARRSIPQL